MFRKKILQMFSDKEFSTIGFIMYRSMNIVDVIQQRLEKYATNLEELVSQRKKQLLHEKHKSDRLLYRLLPK